MSELTPRQADVLAFLRRYAVKHGSFPTIREIGEELDVTSPNGVLCHLKALTAKGYLTNEAAKSRGHRLSVPPGHCPCCAQPLPATARKSARKSTASPQLPPDRGGKTDGKEATTEVSRRQAGEEASQTNKEGRETARQARQAG